MHSSVLMTSSCRILFIAAPRRQWLNFTEGFVIRPKQNSYLRRTKAVKNMYWACAPKTLFWVSNGAWIWDLLSHGEIDGTLREAVIKYASFTRIFPLLYASFRWGDHAGYASRSGWSFTGSYAEMTTSNFPTSWTPFGPHFVLLLLLSLNSLGTGIVDSLFPLPDNFASSMLISWWLT